MAVNKKREILFRAYIGFMLVMLFGAAIIGRAVYIQVYEGKQLIAMADSLTIFHQKVDAERGNIFSADGKLLATSTPIFDVRIDFRAQGFDAAIFNKNVDTVSYLLSELFKDKSAATYRSELVRQRNKHNRYYLLKRNINFSQLQQMKQWPWFCHGQYKSGFMAEAKDKRQQPYAGLAQRTLGFVNGTGDKKVGLEGFYDAVLKGKVGSRLVQKTAEGVLVPLETTDEVEAKPGRDVYTTLDVELQDVAEASLMRALQKHKAHHGCVVLMEVSSGKIKAIANLGVVKDSTYGEVYNYAAGEALEPGSTFKLATAAALMSDRYVNENSLVDLDGGSAHFYNTTVRDHDKPETDMMTVKRAFEVSSNVAFAKLAFDYYSKAPANFRKHLERFGFCSKVNVELPGTPVPVLSPVKKWSGVSTAFIAHGYELKITPLHTLAFYNAIANDGKMVRPTLVTKVSEYGKVIDSATAEVVQEQICDATVVKQLRHMMEGVVTNGTATNLKTDYLSIAGKTGTAVIADNNRGYKNRIYQASFCGYFPADAPKYSMIVVVNSPSNGVYYGNVVAGTIFREVADKVYSLSLDMHPAMNEVALKKTIPLLRGGSTQSICTVYRFLKTQITSGETEWANVEAPQGKLQLTATTMNSNRVPDVKGMMLRDAIYLLETAGLQVKVIGRGNVLQQSVRPNTAFKKGDAITLILG